jgi:hypothetical protein
VELVADKATMSMMSPKNKRVRSMVMVQSKQAEKPENQAQSQFLVGEPQQRQGCDQCSARALMEVTLPSGILTFCLHHYNINAQALTERGAIAKLLIVSQE